MKRRAVLHSTVAAGLGVSFRGFAQEAGISIIDTNVSLFRWPFRRLPLDETGKLLAKMKQLGIAQALAGSFDGIVQRDVRLVNQALADECAGHPELVPVGTVNPALPGWERDFRECIEVHRMPGIRLHPNYHGFRLTDPRFKTLLKLAAQSGVLVQIAALFEDVRTQPEQFRADDVDLAPLADLAIGKIQILNWRPRGAVLEKLAARPEISFDLARTESTDGVATLLDSVPAERVCFGTHAPFLIPEATLIRIFESNPAEAVLRKILQANAERWMAK
ncbi:MAG: metal-dependent hydrolase [Verrucomicrobiales bacterium]|nr:metal-dependent hydrolase [Verrucomicrobiales bacterium]